MHRESGRVYRLRGKESSLAPVVDLDQRTSSQLVALLGQGVRANRQQALRLLYDRRDASTARPLRRILEDAGEETNQNQRALEALWALYASGQWNDQDALRGLAHHAWQVRAWTVRLLGDERRVTDSIAKTLAELASQEPEVQVRSQLASTARRLPLAEAMPIIDMLTTRDEDAGDIHLPLLLWWAVEEHAGRKSDPFIDWLREEAVWRRPLVREYLLERLARRLAEAGGRRNLTQLAELFKLAPDEASRTKLLAGFEQAYQGRPLTDLPDALTNQLAAHGGGSLVLQLRQGKAEAFAEALETLEKGQAKPAELIALLRVLGELKAETAVDAVLRIAVAGETPDVQAAALAALQAFDQSRVAEQVVSALPAMRADPLEAAYSLLASRPAWSMRLVQEVKEGRLAKEQVPKHVLSRLLLHSDEVLKRELESVWGAEATADAASLAATGRIEEYRELLQQGTGNPYNGKRLFQAHCGKCHRLFNEGGQVGPDLTAYQRQDLRRMLTNVLNPSLEIREGFESFVIQTDDGRMVSGFIADQDTQVVSLRGVDGQTMTLPRVAIEEMFAIKTSVMPEGLLKDLKEQEIRDLFAYLRATQPLP